MPPYKLKAKHDDPVMSDLTILVSVEDLINIAMGPTEGNTINFKMIQTVLHILARQMRLLETKVDIKIADIPELKKRKKRGTRTHSSESPSSDASPKSERTEEIDDEKSPDRSGKKSKKITKISKDKETKDRSPKAEEKETTEKKSKKRKLGDQDEGGDQDTNKQIESKAKKIKEIEQKLLEKMSPEEKEAYNKQKEKEENIINTMSPSEKAKYLKEKEKELVDLQQMSPKEKEKKLKEKAKEIKALQAMSPAEREKSLKEKARGRSPEEKEKNQEKTKDESKSTKGKETYQENEKERQQSQKDKEDKILDKMSPKEKELYNKQKERDDKAFDNMSPKEKELYVKQKERENKDLEKMSAAEREKYFDEKEKESRALDKMSPKERLKYLQEKEEEAQALAKMTPSEKEKYLKEKKKQLTKATGSGASIAITEVERQNEKILVVEKGPTTRRASKTSVATIDVVTRSQFNILEAEVEKLKNTAAPLPMPELPQDKKLKADLVKGSASLTDTMQAMQVSARVQAAEKGLARMASLLTQLAASGVLPESIAGKLENAKAEMEALGSSLPGETALKAAGAGIQRKSVAITSTKEDRVESGPTSVSTRPSSAGTDVARASVVSAVASRRSRASSAVRPIAVTRTEMDDAIQSLRDDMTKTMHNMTYRAASSAETAAGTARTIADKMEVAMKINSRISDLYALTSDYAQQLSGFDAGLTTQMQSFQEQMMQMRGDLKSGLALLEMANTNAETAAVLELTDRYNDLHTQLDEIGVEHQRLTSFQKQLREELQSLVEAVEVLKEQKADRDEVWDGLRDKADLSKLSGLLTEEGFSGSKAELDKRLDVCYEKFNKQEAVWITALRDLTDVASEKAEIMQLLSIREDAQQQLQGLQDILRRLTIQLGEPKAAVLTRLLSKDGKCGACHLPALMEGTEKSAGKPFQMPALRAPPDGQPCLREVTPAVAEDEGVKSHICKRWVGGSHTLLPRSEPREMAPTQIGPTQPVKKYTGYGADGKLYHMEMELEPCIECNKLTGDEAGAGDSKVCDCVARGDKCDCWPEARAEHP